MKPALTSDGLYLGPHRLTPKARPWAGSAPASPMNLEDRARQDIDRQLGRCGWAVQDKGQMNISAALGVAVGEFPMLTGEVHYRLYVSGKAIGVLEAKPKGHPLIGVETQASRYSGALQPAVPAYKSPLKFAYESTGAVTQFTNLLEPDARSREVFTFHRPEELRRRVREPSSSGHLRAASSPKTRPTNPPRNSWSASDSSDSLPSRCIMDVWALDEQGDRVGGQTRCSPFPRTTATDREANHETRDPDDHLDERPPLRTPPASSGARPCPHDNTRRRSAVGFDGVPRAKQRPWSSSPLAESRCRPAVH
jgi:hypothetical protein